MTIFRYNIMRIFGRKVNLIFMFLVPILLNLLLISTSSKDTKFLIGIYDQDNTPFTKDISKKLDSECKVVKLGTKDKIEQIVIDGEVDLAIVFGKGYTKSLIDGNAEKVKTYELTDNNQEDSGKMYLESIIAAANSIGKACNHQEHVFYEGMKHYYKGDYQVDYPKFKTSLNEKVDFGLTSLGFIAFGMVFLMTSGTLLIMEDKLNGVYTRIHITPLSMFQYFAENLLSFVVVAVLQIVILFAAVPRLAGVSFGSNWCDVVQTGIVSVLFGVVCISIGIVICRFAKTSLMVDAVIMLVNIPMLMLGGCFWPKEIMPAAMQKIGDFVPTTWFLDAAKQTMYGNGLQAAIPQIVAMLGFSIVLLLIAFLIRTEKE